MIVQSEVEGASGSDQHVGQVGMVNELLAMRMWKYNLMFIAYLCVPHMVWSWRVFK